MTTEVTPFGLAGSGGSTPLRIGVKGDPDLFGKLYAITHLRSDRWYKLGRTLLYGRLEDEKAFNTVRRLVQYEDYVLHLMHDAGLPVPRPYGFVEITPEREYLLVTEFFAGAREIGDVDVVDESMIDQGLRIVRTLWEIGIAHRDIKPANVLVRDGRVLLIDTAFAEVRPSPWRQAVDLANMMLVLALGSDAETVYERALRQFSVEEITEAFAATRGLTMPSQLGQLIRKRGRDLHEEFLRLLPERPVPIADRSAGPYRRVGLLLVVFVAAVLAATVARGLLWKPAVKGRALLAVLALAGRPAAPTGPVVVGSAAGLPHCDPGRTPPRAGPSRWPSRYRAPEWLPCVREVPVGWTFISFEPEDGRTRIGFGSDRDGDSALTVYLRPTCDLSGAAEVPSEQPGDAPLGAGHPGQPRVRRRAALHLRRRLHHVPVRPARRHPGRAGRHDLRGAGLPEPGERRAAGARLQRRPARARPPGGIAVSGGPHRTPRWWAEGLSGRSRGAPGWMPTRTVSRPPSSSPSPAPATTSSGLCAPR